MSFVHKAYFLLVSQACAGMKQRDNLQTEAQHEQKQRKKGSHAVFINDILYGSCARERFVLSLLGTSIH